MKPSQVTHTIRNSNEQKQTERFKFELPSRFGSTPQQSFKHQMTHLPGCWIIILRSVKTLIVL